MKKLLILAMLIMVGCSKDVELVDEMETINMEKEIEHLESFLDTTSSKRTVDAQYFIRLLRRYRGYYARGYINDARLNRVEDLISYLVDGVLFKDITMDSPPRDYLDLFVNDVYVNMDTSYGYFSDITISLDNTNEGTYASAYGTCDDSAIHISINPDYWNSFNKVQRLWLMYHELGHDVLGIGHTKGGSVRHPETNEIVILNWNIMTSHAAFKANNKDLSFFVENKNKMLSGQDVSYWRCN